MVYTRVFEVIAKRTIKGLITKGMRYEVRYTTEDNHQFNYEIEADNGEYVSLDSEYFEEEEEM